METSDKINFKLYDTSMIQDGFLGSKWTDADRELLAKGEMSSLKNEMKLKDGTLQDGKISLTKDSDGQTAVKFHFKKEKLIVPKQLLNKELTEEEHVKLQNNNEILIKYKGEDFKVRVDKEINQVVIKGKREISTMSELGGYLYTDKEENTLMNGGKVPAKVYKGEKGYFMAEVSLTEDKKGIQFHNIKALDRDKAFELIEVLNKPDEKITLSTLAGEVNQIEQILDRKLTSQEFNNNYWVEIKVEFPKELSLLANQDMKGLSEIKKLNPEKDFSKLSTVLNESALSTEKKIAAFTILGIDLDKNYKQENGMTAQGQRDQFKAQQQEIGQQKTMQQNKSLSL